jgi:hypothetical protein
MQNTATIVKGIDLANEWNLYVDAASPLTSPSSSPVAEGAAEDVRAEEDSTTLLSRFSTIRVCFLTCDSLVKLKSCFRAFGDISIIWISYLIDCLMRQTLDCSRVQKVLSGLGAPNSQEDSGVVIFLMILHNVEKSG